MDEASVIRDTECWVRDVVVGLNLCPFAAAPLGAGRVRFEVCGETNLDAIYRALLTEMGKLLALSEVAPAFPGSRDTGTSCLAEAETGLFIVPAGLEAFDDYLDLLYSADEAIVQAELDDQLQLASFHPDYCFEAAAADDPANYTNRSPHPMFHLIRQQPMSRALQHYPDAQEIPRRNAERLRQLGLPVVQELLARCRRDPSGEVD